MNSLSCQLVPLEQWWERTPAPHLLDAPLTEKKVDSSSPVLVKAPRTWSSWPTQQHSNFILLSHTLAAAVLSPMSTWLASWLSRVLGLTEEWATGLPPSGSKAMTMITMVMAMMIQLQGRNRGSPVG